MHEDSRTLKILRNYEMLILLRNRTIGRILRRNLHVSIDRYDTNVAPPLATRLGDKSANKIIMCGWQIHNYGGIEELQFTDKLKIPQIRKTNDCLIKVMTSSVNPIDVAMLGGYGAEVLNRLRCQPNSIEFPLTLGREFCGVLIQKGMNVSNVQLPVGKRVWGVVPVENTSGAHAQYVTVPEYCLSTTPSSLNNEEAAAVLYTGLTAWSGLYITASIGGICGALNAANRNDLANKRILVLGGSGSVGSMAIQMLKAENAHVVATCSENAKQLVKNFGADHVVDYCNSTEMLLLKQYAPYDVILDCSGQGVQALESLDVPYHQYVTFSSPLLKNIDNSGLGIGLVKNVVSLLEANAKSLTKRNGLVKWGFFAPSSKGIHKLKQLVECKKLIPHIEKIYEFEELPEAFQHVKKGHLRGKIVIKVP